MKKLVSFLVLVSFLGSSSVSPVAAFDLGGTVGFLAKTGLAAGMGALIDKDNRLRGAGIGAGAFLGSQFLKGYQQRAEAQEKAEVKKRGQRVAIILNGPTEGGFEEVIRAGTEQALLEIGYEVVRPPQQWWDWWNGRGESSWAEGQLDIDSIFEISYARVGDSSGSWFGGKDSGETQGKTVDLFLKGWRVRDKSYLGFGEGTGSYSILSGVDTKHYRRQSSPDDHLVFKATLKAAKQAVKNLHQ